MCQPRSKRSRKKPRMMAVVVVAVAVSRTRPRSATGPIRRRNPKGLLRRSLDLTTRWNCRLLRRREIRHIRRNMTVLATLTAGFRAGTTVPAQAADRGPARERARAADAAPETVRAMARAAATV